MNVLEVEQVKVAELQAPDLLLLPGSLAMEEVHRWRGGAPGGPAGMVYARLSELSKQASIACRGF